MNAYCQQLAIQWKIHIQQLGIPQNIFEQALNYFPDDEQIDLNILCENYGLFRRLFIMLDATPEMLIMLSGHFNWVDNYLDKNNGAHHLTENAITCAHLVAIAGDAEIMYALLQIYPQLLKITYKGNTIAHYAARFGRLDCLKKIIENDPDNFCLNSLNNNKVSLENTALQFKQHDCVNFLKQIQLSKRKTTSPSDDNEGEPVQPPLKRSATTVTKVPDTVSTSLATSSTSTREKQIRAEHQEVAGLATVALNQNAKGWVASSHSFLKRKSDESEQPQEASEATHKP